MSQVWELLVIHRRVQDVVSGAAPMFNRPYRTKCSQRNINHYGIAA